MHIVNPFLLYARLCRTNKSTGDTVMRHNDCDGRQDDGKGQNGDGRHDDGKGQNGIGGHDNDNG